MLQCPVDPLKYMELRFIKGRTPPIPAVRRIDPHGRDGVFFSFISLNAKNHPEVPLGPKRCEKGGSQNHFKMEVPGSSKTIFPGAPGNHIC